MPEIWRKAWREDHVNTWPQFSNRPTIINGRAPQWVPRAGKNRRVTALGTQSQPKGSEAPSNHDSCPKLLAPTADTMSSPTWEASTQRVGNVLWRPPRRGRDASEVLSYCLLWANAHSSAKRVHPCLHSAVICHWWAVKELFSVTVSSPWGWRKQWGDLLFWTYSW